MAIVKMKFVSAATDEDHFGDLLLTGTGSNLLHVIEGAKLIDEENGDRLLDDDDPYSDCLQTLRNYSHAINYTPVKKEKSDKTYSPEEIDAFLNELKEAFGIDADAESVVLTPDDEAALKALSVCDFEKIDACRYLNFGFGRLPKESFKKLALYKDEIFVHHRLHENKNYIWMIYVTSDSYKEKAEKIFDSLFFEPVAIPTINVDKLLAKYNDQINDIYTYCLYRNEIIKSEPYIAIINDKYVLSGFVKADDVETYKNLFVSLPVDFAVRDPSEVKKVKCPTLLKNGWFARPFELFVEMYSLPSYDDFDPTLFLSLTYCLLFGIMFGDLGQGAVLMLLGLFMEARGKGKLWGVIGRVGFTSMIFGFLFGSVFGYEDVLNPVHQSLFGVREKLIDVMANDTTMGLLEGALLVGAVLILCSMLLNMFNNIRHRDWGELLFSQNGIAGFIMYGYVLIAAAQILLTSASGLLSIPFIIVFAVVPCLCFVLKEPLANLVMKRPVTPHGGWGGYFTESIFEVLEILLSFVTNSMSYLRVGGFILSHAGMMLVVMTLAEMIGGGGIAVVIFGNAFVMVLEGLIVGIQTLRLEYYEMFGRYYNGGGIKYEAANAGMAES